MPPWRGSWALCSFNVRRGLLSSPAILLGNITHRDPENLLSAWMSRKDVLGGQGVNLSPTPGNLFFSLLMAEQSVLLTKLFSVDSFLPWFPLYTTPMTLSPLQVSIPSSVPSFGWHSRRSPHLAPSCMYAPLKKFQFVQFKPSQWFLQYCVLGLYGKC